MPLMSRLEFENYVSSTLPDNDSGEISEADIRSAFACLAESALWHDEATTGPTGPSAYDIAVANGFRGSETEWLESLVGAVGPVGLEGPKGSAGANGVNVAGVREVAKNVYSIGRADEAILLTFSDVAGTTVTLPSDATANFRSGAQVHLMQTGGQVSVVGASGVTLEHDVRGVPRTAGPMATLTVVKVGTDQWYVCGGLELVETLPILHETAEISKAPSALDFRGEGVAVSETADGTVSVTVRTMDRGGTLAGVESVAATIYSPTAKDVGKLIEIDSATAAVVTLPDDVAVPVGAVIHIAQAGVGSVTLSAYPGVILKHCESVSPMLAGPNAVVSVTKTAADTWRCTGQLRPVHAFA